MRKKIFFFIGIVVLCLVAWGFFLYNKPHSGVGNRKAEVTIQADSLYALYEQNEAEADKRFLNKIIAVTGTVAEVTATDSTCTVLLKPNDAMGGISCNLFDKNNTNMQVKQGDNIQVKGRCAGFLMDVALTDCVIEK